MINFTVKGIQYKKDKHSEKLSSTYENLNILVIPSEDFNNIKAIVVSCSKYHNIVEVWKELCNASKYFNCNMICWFNDCQFVVNPNSNPDLIDNWASYIIEYRLLVFGPYSPKKNKTYEKFNDSYKAVERSVNRIYRELKEAKRKKANLLYNMFACDIKDEIKPEEFSPGTPKVVKKHVNEILKMIIGINSGKKEKYLIDFDYDLSKCIAYSPNGRKNNVKETLFLEWIDSLEDMKGNYGNNFDIAICYIDKYLLNKLRLSEDEYNNTNYKYFGHLTKNFY